MSNINGLCRRNVVGRGGTVGRSSSSANVNFLGSSDIIGFGYVFLISGSMSDMAEFIINVSDHVLLSRTLDGSNMLINALSRSSLGSVSFGQEAGVTNSLVISDSIGLRNSLCVNACN